MTCESVAGSAWLLIQKCRQAFSVPCSVGVSAFVSARRRKRQLSKQKQLHLRLQLPQQLLLLLLHLWPSALGRLW
jgi:hypothetical protein